MVPQPIIKPEVSSSVWAGRCERRLARHPARPSSRPEALCKQASAGCDARLEKQRGLTSPLSADGGAALLTFTHNANGHLLSFPLSFLKLAKCPCSRRELPWPALRTAREVPSRKRRSRSPHRLSAWGKKMVPMARAVAWRQSGTPMQCGREAQGRLVVRAAGAGAASSAAVCCERAECGEA